VQQIPDQTPTDIKCVSSLFISEGESELSEDNHIVIRHFSPRRSSNILETFPTDVYVSAPNRLRAIPGLLIE